MVDFNSEESSELRKKLPSPKTIMDMVGDSMYIDWYKRQEYWSKNGKAEINYKKLKNKLSKALQNNRKDDKKVTRRLEKDVKAWKKDFDKAIDNYYDKVLETEIPFLTEDNIDSFIEKYKDQTYISYYPPAKCEDQLEDCATYISMAKKQMDCQLFRADSALNYQKMTEKKHQDCQDTVNKQKKLTEEKDSRISWLKKQPSNGGVLEQRVFEMLFFPFAFFDKNSLFHNSLRKGYKSLRMNWSKRAVLTFLSRIVWVIIVLSVFNLDVFKRQRAKSEPKPNIKESTINVNDNGENKKAESLNNVNRGGSQTILMDTFDPILIQIRALRFSRESDRLSLKSWQNSLRNKSKNIRQPISKIMSIIPVWYLLEYGEMSLDQDFLITTRKQVVVQEHLLLSKMLFKEIRETHLQKSTSFLTIQTGNGNYQIQIKPNQTKSVFKPKELDFRQKTTLEDLGKPILDQAKVNLRSKQRSKRVKKRAFWQRFANLFQSKKIERPQRMTRNRSQTGSLSKLREQDKKEVNQLCEDILTQINTLPNLWRKNPKKAEKLSQDLLTPTGKWQKLWEKDPEVANQVYRYLLVQNQPHRPLRVTVNNKEKVNKLYQDQLTHLSLKEKAYLAQRLLEDVERTIKKIP